MTKINFICRQCGKCCTNLKQKEKSMLRGLTLLPNEITLFSEKHIRPYLGVGKQPNHSEFEIIAYQLNEDSCPNLDNKKCKHYIKRPTSCRQYPFSLDLGRKSEIVFGIDLNCPSAIELVNDSEGKINFQNMNSAVTLLELKKKVLKVEEKIWVFDLISNTWYKYENK